jgi:hypothetical protein
MLGHRRALAVAVSVCLVVLGATTAAAVVPANDAFASATEISTLPYEVYVPYEDVRDATAEVGEPSSCAYGGLQRTMWWRLMAPETGSYQLTTIGSFERNVAVFSGTDLSALSQVACSGDVYSTARTQFTATAGQTYYLRVGGAYGDYGSLTLKVARLVPPANDAFGDAVPVTIPGTFVVPDLTGATFEAGEPNPASLRGSAWWSFSVDHEDSVTIRLTDWRLGYGLYEGAELTSLQLIAAREYGDDTSVFRAMPGHTYVVQVGPYYYNYSGEPSALVIEFAPPPEVSTWYNPDPPSSFDDVTFGAYVDDPAGGWVEAYLWDFGDGTTSTDGYTSHGFAADGDYTVGLTVTMADGRTGWTSVVVPVQTHDVAVMKVGAPKSATAGQTKPVTVDLSNRRYAEDAVRVCLMKSVPGTYYGYEEVGCLTGYVPVRLGGRTTRFTFSYTFTAMDARVGKVSFKAVAELMGAYPDALPGDNEGISGPVKVTR